MDKENCLKQFGSWPLAYLTKQSILDTYETKKGYLAYTRNAVLGDAVCDKKDAIDLLTTFTHTHPKACFYHIQEHSAKILSQLGYYITAIGQEHSINLQKFKGTWKTHKSLRSGFNKSQKKGVYITQHRHNTTKDIGIKITAIV